MEWYLHSLVALSATIDPSLSGNATDLEFPFKELSFHYADFFLFVCLSVFPEAFRTALIGLVESDCILKYP